jgi:hypothetical protein
VAILVGSRDPFFYWLTAFGYSNNQREATLLQNVKSEKLNFENHWHICFFTAILITSIKGGTPAHIFNVQHVKIYKKIPTVENELLPFDYLSNEKQRVNKKMHFKRNNSLQLSHIFNCGNFFVDLYMLNIFDSLLFVTQIIKGKQLYYKMWSRKS